MDPGVRAPTLGRLVAAVALAAAFVAFAATAGVATVHSVLEARRLQADRLERLIDVTAARVSEAVAAGDREATARELDLLTIAGDAAAVAVRLPDGSLFASVGDESLLREDASARGSDHIWRTQNIVEDRVDVGDLVVVARNGGAGATVSDARFALLALVGALLAAGSLGAFLSRLVARPFEETLSALPDATRRAGGKRLPARGPRELHALIEQLNRLIADAGQRGDDVAGLVTQLREARDLAEASNVAKTRFLAHMSHELRTPLNAIMGYTKFVTEDLVGPEHEQSRDDLSRVKRASEHLLSLISQVLDLSKIEAGSMTLDLSGVDVGAVVRQVVETSAPLAERNGNTLSLSACPKGEVIVTDVLRLRQCLLNVVGNALKFTSQGRVEVRARLEKTADGRIFICEVQDTGPGIPADKIASIFEPFVQVDDDNAHKQAGTGLGLAITKRLCAAMGGGIGCTSVLGKGSTFTITIRDSAEGVAKRAA